MASVDRTEESKSYYSLNRECILAKSKALRDEKRANMSDADKQAYRDEQRAYNQMYYDKNRHIFSERYKANSEKATTEKRRAYAKAYNDKHKERLKEQTRLYLLANPHKEAERILKRSVLSKCACGAIISHGTKSVHMKSKNHITRLAEIAEHGKTLTLKEKHTLLETGPIYKDGVIIGVFHKNSTATDGPKRIYLKDGATYDEQNKNIKCSCGSVVSCMGYYAHQKRAKHTKLMYLLNNK